MSLKRLSAAFQRGVWKRCLSTFPSALMAIAKFTVTCSRTFDDWAGEYRFVDTGRTGPFCRAQFIAREMEKRVAAINAEGNLRGLTREQFAERAAEHICELNAIHPFLDGNGRTQRAFLQILGKQAGHDIDLARIDPERWNQASIESYYKQIYVPMLEVIRGILA